MPCTVNSNRLWWKPKKEWKEYLRVCSVIYGSDCTASNGKMIKRTLKESGVAYFGQCPEFSLEVLKKTTKYFGLTSQCPGRYSQLPEALAPQPIYSDLKTCQQWLIHCVGQCPLCESHLRYVTLRTLDRFPSPGARRN